MIDHLHTYFNTDKSLMYVYANHFYPDLAFCDSTAGSAEPKRLEEVCRNLFFRAVKCLSLTKQQMLVSLDGIWFGEGGNASPTIIIMSKKIRRSAFNDQNTLIIDH